MWGGRKRVDRRKARVSLWRESAMATATAAAAAAAAGVGRRKCMIHTAHVEDVLLARLTVRGIPWIL